MSAATGWANPARRPVKERKDRIFIGRERMVDNGKETATPADRSLYKIRRNLSNGLER
jgi:hypothetical protein